MRKIIHTLSIGTHDGTYVLATCDDGTVWLSSFDRPDKKWYPYPNVPQKQEPEKTTDAIDLEGGL